MAISYLGYEVFEDSDGTWSETATLPAGTDCVVLVLAGYDPAAPDVSTISLGGTGMVFQTEDLETSFHSTHLYTQIATGTGAKTFACTMDSDWTVGGFAILMYFSGVDQTTPVRDKVSEFCV